MALIGLNLLGAMGVGKNVQNVRSKSRVTKLFVACGAGALGGQCTLVVEHGREQRPRGAPW